MVRITRVYTRTGDRGQTRLAGGQKIAKDDARLEAYGTVDELMSVLALVTASAEAEAAPWATRLCDLVRRVQNELFNLGATLAMLPEDVRPATPRILPRHVKQLERDIDALNGELPALTSFVLPGGGPAAAALHQARTVCRRAERAVIRLGRTAPLPDEAVRYLNRLSDLLFVAARWAAARSGRAEPIWRPEQT
jgi:cob(I)alamin adenosyltransferase